MKYTKEQVESTVKVKGMFGLKIQTTKDMM